MVYLSELFVLPMVMAAGDARFRSVLSSHPDSRYRHRPGDGGGGPLRTPLDQPLPPPLVPPRWAPTCLSLRDLSGIPHHSQHPNRSTLKLPTSPVTTPPLPSHLPLALHRVRQLSVFQTFQSPHNSRTINRLFTNSN